jgi:glycosyltransferase involved in cell wall biosynthesis
MNVISPKVSVLVLTFNHAPYIRECLESLVQQTTNFLFEIIISDDYSNDGTREILNEYAEKYPKLITVFLHEKNMGGSPNYLFLHNQANGEYIAYLDGDDYALPGKLQVQSDFLDSNSRCNIVWHRVFTKNGDLDLKPDQVDITKFPQNGFERRLILALISIGTSSSRMFRAKNLNFPTPDFAVTDYFANIEQVRDGFATYVNDNIYGVYRLGVGISSKSTFPKVLLAKSFLYFSKRYPAERQYVNTACLLLFLADAKNFRSTAPLYFKTWVKTFHHKCFFNLIKYWSISKMLRF